MTVFDCCRFVATMKDGSCLLPGKSQFHADGKRPESISIPNINPAVLCVVDEHVSWRWARISQS